MCVGLAVELALQPQQRRGIPETHLGLAVQGALVGALQGRRARSAALGVATRPGGLGGRLATLRPIQAGQLLPVGGGPRTVGISLRTGPEIPAAHRPTNVEIVSRKVPEQTHRPACGG